MFIILQKICIYATFQLELQSKKLRKITTTTTYDLKLKCKNNNTMKLEKKATTFRAASII